MYLKSKMRLLGMSALVSVGLIAANSADAYSVRLGSLDIQVDTTVSSGVSFSVVDRDTDYLPEGNGGPTDSSTYFAEGFGQEWTGTADAASGQVGAVANGVTLGTTAFATTCKVYGTFCQEVDGKENFDGSINTDDGRLNFDNGDMTSGNVKFTSDLFARNGNVSGLLRIKGFYDGVLDNDESFERDAGTTYRDVVSDATILDAYVSVDSDLGSMPTTVRIGRQVINWGESTFLTGGNSVFSPIDVPAIRRPGAEIKEALLPVEAIYGSIAVNDNVSIEAYYGGWDDYKLDSGGTFMASADFINSGGANAGRIMSGGGFGSGAHIACRPAELTAAGMGASAELTSVILNTGIVPGGETTTANSGDGCGTQNASTDLLVGNTLGKVEEERASRNSWYHADMNMSMEEEGSESMGIALRVYSETLNSTEFGLYYQKYDSRIPYAKVVTGTPGVGYSGNSASSSTLGRGVGPLGCYDAYLAAGAVGSVGQTYAAGKFYQGATSAGVDPKAIMVDDPYNLLDNMRDALESTAVKAALATNAATYQSVGAGAGSAGAGLVALGRALDETKAAYYVSDAPRGSMAEMSELNCLMQFAQINPMVNMESNAFAAYDAVGQLPTGAVSLTPTWNIDYALVYPTIEVMGASFATTVLGWGVQGEIAHRPEMPLALDGDAGFIRGIFNSCGLGLLNAVEAAYAIQGTYAGNGCQSSSSTNTFTTEHDVTNWDIGTTATFTRSNPIVSFLGADLAVLLTEFGGVLVNDIEEERGTSGFAALGSKTPLASVCTSGNDLPLNGVLSIDTNPKEVCRPTDSSYGAVLFGQLQYNNVFGTPLALKPTIVFSEGLEGNSPSPAAFWREGTGSTGFVLNVSYLDSLQGSLSYRTYHGDKKYTRNLDRDEVGVNISYAF